MNHLRSFIILLCINFVVSDDLCASQNPCECVLHNKTIIDLSSVGSLIYPRFYEVLFESNCTETKLYSYNPCFPFDSSDKPVETKSGHTPCIGASACVRVPGTGDGKQPEEHAIGLQSSAAFEIDKTQIYISYSVPTSKRKLMVALICDSTSKDHKLTLEEPECESSEQASDKPIRFNLTSKCACPGGCKSVLPGPEPSGMSTGSKLLIAFFTIFLAYMLIGVVWNYCNGSQGMELIPNIEFWNDLPTLILEGVAFTFSCCGRQSSYGAV